MNHVIDILYAEPSHSERDLVRDTLEKQSGFRVWCARSRDEFESRLDKGSYDVVLSEFDVFDYGELEVIAAVGSKDCKVPVVIITGRGSEEMAVKALKSGAADYVVKNSDGMRRLPSTIRSVVDMTHNPTCEASGLPSRFRAFARQLPDHLMLLDRDGTILEMNYDTEYLKRRAAVGRRILEVVPRNDRENVQGAERERSSVPGDC
ncbi:MAG: response regulator [bacterium]